MTNVLSASTSTVVMTELVLTVPVVVARGLVKSAETAMAKTLEISRSTNVKGYRCFVTGIEFFTICRLRGVDKCMHLG